MITWYVPWRPCFSFRPIYNLPPCWFRGFVRKISNFLLNTEIYIPLVLLIQNMYSFEGLYLTVLESITYKQTERALYIGDGTYHSNPASGRRLVCSLHRYLGNKAFGNGRALSCIPFLLGTAIAVGDIYLI